MITSWHWNAFSITGLLWGGGGGGGGGGFTGWQNENVWISIKISLNFVPKVPINNIPALVQIMAWRRSGDKPLSESMVDSLLTHICVTRPQWVKPDNSSISLWNSSNIFQKNLTPQKYLIYSFIYPVRDQAHTQNDPWKVSIRLLLWKFMIYNYVWIVLREYD